VNLKGQTRDPNTLIVQYLENGRRIETANEELNGHENTVVAVMPIFGTHMSLHVASVAVAADVRFVLERELRSNPSVVIRRIATFP